MFGSRRVARRTAHAPPAESIGAGVEQVPHRAAGRTLDAAHPTARVVGPAGARR